MILVKEYNMKRYTIKEPIWATRSIGIADYRLKEDLIVNISYKDKLGNLLFPGEFLVKKDIAKTYPTQNLKGNLTLHIIPIEDLIKWKRKTNEVI